MLFTVLQEMYCLDEKNKAACILAAALSMLWAIN